MPSQLYPHSPSAPSLTAPSSTALFPLTDPVPSQLHPLDSFSSRLNLLSPVPSPTRPSLTGRPMAIAPRSLIPQSSFHLVLSSQPFFFSNSLVPKQLHLKILLPLMDQFPYGSSPPFPDLFPSQIHSSWLCPQRILCYGFPSCLIPSTTPDHPCPQARSPLLHPWHPGFPLPAHPCPLQPCPCPQLPGHGPGQFPGFPGS